MSICKLAVEISTRLMRVWREQLEHWSAAVSRDRDFSRMTNSPCEDSFLAAVKKLFPSADEVTIRGVWCLLSGAHGQLSSSQFRDIVRGVYTLAQLVCTRQNPQNLVWDEDIQNVNDLFHSLSTKGILIGDTDKRDVWRLWMSLGKKTVEMLMKASAISQFEKVRDPTPFEEARHVILSLLDEGYEGNLVILWEMARAKDSSPPTVNSRSFVGAVKCVMPLKDVREEEIEEVWKLLSGDGQPLERREFMAAMSVFQVADELAQINWNLILQVSVDVDFLVRCLIGTGSMSEERAERFETLWKIHGQDRIKSFLLSSKEALFGKARRVIEDLKKFVANCKMSVIWQLVRGSSLEQSRSVDSASFTKAVGDLSSEWQKLVDA